MVIFALTAWAGPLDGLAPLPACTPDTGVQQVLPNLPEDLRFDADGRLWMADWSGLSVHDAQLDVLERPAAGTHGWVRLVDDEEHGMVGDHAYGDAFPPVQLDHDKKLVRHHLGEAFEDPSLNRMGLRPKLEHGGEIGEHELLHTLAVDDLELKYDGVTKAGDPWARWSEDVHSITLDPARSFARDLVGRRTRSIAMEPRTMAIDEEGRVAAARGSELRLFDADAQPLATLPVVRSTDAAGIVRDRLFTVTHGTFRLWSATNGRSWVAPGTWTSAVTVDDDVLLADLEGRLWSLDLDTGALARRACVRGRCKAPKERSLPPPPTGDAKTLGPQVVAWKIAVQGWLDAHPPAPVQLHRFHDRVVVAHLHPELWLQDGVHVLTALTVLDGNGKKVLAHRELERPFFATVRRGRARSVVLTPETAYPDAQQFRLSDLQPVQTHPEGYAVVTDSYATMGSRVRVGRYEEDRFRPAAGLPVRHGLQHRLDGYGVFTEDRFVVSSRPSPGRPTAPTGSTEVWCTPRITGPAQTVLPGVLSTNPTAERPWERKPDPRSEALRKRLESSPREPRLPGYTPYWATLADGPFWLWTSREPELDEALFTLDRKLPLVVFSDHPAPDDLPPDTTWRTPLGRTSSLQLVDRGVVLWTGSPADHTPLLERATDQPRPLETDLSQPWAERMDRAPTEPRTAPPPSPAQRMTQHLRAGELDEARALYATLESPPTLRAQDLDALLAGTPLPEGLVVDGPIEGSTYLLGVRVWDRNLWRAADALGVPAVTVERQGRHDVHPGLVTGSAPEGVLPLKGGFVLVRDGRMERFWSAHAAVEDFAR